MSRTLKIAALSLAAIMIVATAAAKEPNSWGWGWWNKKPCKVKNVIIMISDGWGQAQIDAADYYQYGKKGKQSYQKFPVKMHMSTYMSDGGYIADLAMKYFSYVRDEGATDSAAAATAMSTGEKTYSGAIGVNIDEEALVHLMELAETKGKATGVVSSVEFSHATPAAFLAHNVSRNNYAEIAQEMISMSAAEVIMGCGNYEYDNSGNPGAGNPKYVGGADYWASVKDGTVATADADGDGMADAWTLIQEKADFEAYADFDAEVPNRVLGVPNVYQTLQHNRDGDYHADAYAVPFSPGVPSLETMTRAALNVLDNDEDGLVLMVEGGAVDWAGHGNSSGRVIEEQIDFNKSVDAVMEWVRKNSNWRETLLIVTGDHETGYCTGPDSGQTEDGKVINPVVNNGKGNMPGMEWHSGSHTNQLIPFFVKGRGAHKFIRRSLKNVDPILGRYVDNTDVAEVAIEMLH